MSSVTKDIVILTSFKIAQGKAHMTYGSLTDVAWTFKWIKPVFCN